MQEEQNDTSVVADTVITQPMPNLKEVDPVTLYNEIGIYFRYFDDVLPEEERLPNKVEAFLTVSKRTTQNDYRFVYDGPKSKVNPFIYEAVPFKEQASPDIRKDQDSLAEVIAMYIDSVDLRVVNDFSAFLDVVNEIAISRPDLMTISWNELPDPPKITDNHYLPLINDIQLEMTSFEDPFKDFKVEGIAKKPSYWKLYGKSNLQLAQRHITYWDNGGVSSFTLLGIFNYDAIYQKKKLKWENELELKLGMMQSDENGTEKSDDNFNFSSRIGYRAVNNWYYTINTDLRTQFINKNDNDADDFAFLSPADLKLAMGMEYKKKKSLSVFVSPLTANFTFVIDTSVVAATRYGIPEGEKMKSELGGYIKAAVKKKFSEDYFWTSKLYIFSNYEGFPDNTDFDWENILEFKVNHLISARISCHLKYDHDRTFVVGKDADGNDIKKHRWQFNELLSLGLHYYF